MTDLILPRRKFLAGLGVLLAAPAIVRASSLMPVRGFENGFEFSGFYSTSPLGQLIERNFYWASPGGIITLSQFGDPDSWEISPKRGRL